MSPPKPQPDPGRRLRLVRPGQRGVQASSGDQPYTSRMNDRQAGSGHTAERLTVNLGARASAALTVTTTEESLTKTDVVNRALVLYRLVWETTAEGGELFVRDRTGATQVVKFL